MTAYIIRRLLATIPVMVVVALFVFLLLHLTPGDPAAVIAGDDATPEAVDGIRTKLGLDQPIHVQFGIYAANLLRGDLGTSIFSNLPVLTLVKQRLEPSLVLAASTLVMAVLLAIPMGVLAAWKARTFIDRFVMGFSVLGFAVPVFLVGYLLIYVFAIELKWLPVQGYRPLSQGIDQTARSIILPALLELAAAPDPALFRARPGLCGADRPHHPCQHARRAVSGLHTHGQGQGGGDLDRTVAPCAEERRRANNHRHWHRLDAADLRRRHHRDSFQHTGPGAPNGGRHPEAGLPHHPRPDHPICRGQGACEPAHRY